MSSFVKNFCSNVYNNQGFYAAVAGGIGNAIHNHSLGAAKQVQVAEAIFKGALMGYGALCVVRGLSGSSAPKPAAAKNPDEVLADIHTLLQPVERALGLPTPDARASDMQYAARVQAVATAAITEQQQIGRLQEEQAAMCGILDSSAGGGSGAALLHAAKQAVDSIHAAPALASAKPASAAAASSASASATAASAPAATPAPASATAASTPAATPAPASATAASTPAATTAPASATAPSSSSTSSSSTHRRSGRHSHHRHRSPSTSSSSRSPTPRSHHHHHSCHRRCCR